MMLCTFTSEINEIASDIVYELHDFNENYYLIKWNTGNHKHEIKDKKTIVNKLFDSGKYVKC